MYVKLVNGSNYRSKAFGSAHIRAGDVIAVSDEDGARLLEIPSRTRRGESATMWEEVSEENVKKVAFDFTPKTSVADDEEVASTPAVKTRSTRTAAKAKTEEA